MSAKTQGMSKSQPGHLGGRQAEVSQAEGPGSTTAGQWEKFQLPWNRAVQ